MARFIEVPLMEVDDYATINVDQIALIIPMDDTRGSFTRIIMATGSLNPAYVETRLTQKRLREMMPLQG
jgi:hypothetical protein